MLRHGRDWRRENSVVCSLLFFSELDVLGGLSAVSAINTVLKPSTYQIFANSYGRSNNNGGNATCGVSWSFSYSNPLYGMLFIGAKTEDFSGSNDEINRLAQQDRNLHNSISLVAPGYHAYNLMIGISVQCTSSRFEISHNGGTEYPGMILFMFFK